MLSIDFGTSDTVAAHTDPVRGTVETFVESDAVRPVSVVYGRAVAEHGGRRPRTVVLTHPDTWTAQQIRSLIDSAVRAGVDSRSLVTVSKGWAAVDFFTRSERLQRGSVVAVLDLGYETADAAVFTVGGGGAMRLAAVGSDRALGGRNLDAVVRRMVERALVVRDPDAAAQLRVAPVHVHRDLDAQVRRAKERLSREDTATVTVRLEECSHTLTLGRDEFDAAIVPVIDRAVTGLRAALADAGLPSGTVPDVLYLTGGSARIPSVRSTLGGLCPVRAAGETSTVVAEGALVAVENRRRSSRARTLGWLRPVGIAVAAVLVAAGIAVAVSRGLTHEPVVVHVSGSAVVAQPFGGAVGAPQTAGFASIPADREHSAVPVHQIEDSTGTDQNRDDHE